MRKQPPTRMMRVRLSDLERMKELARRANKRLPDFQSELLKYYKRKRR